MKTDEGKTRPNRIYIYMTSLALTCRASHTHTHETYTQRVYTHTHTHCHWIWILGVTNLEAHWHQSRFEHRVICLSTPLAPPLQTLQVAPKSKKEFHHDFVSAPHIALLPRAPFAVQHARGGHARGFLCPAFQQLEEPTGRDNSHHPDPIKGNRDGRGVDVPV